MIEVSCRCTERKNVCVLTVQIGAIPQVFTEGACLCDYHSKHARQIIINWFQSTNMLLHIVFICVCEIITWRPLWRWKCLISSADMPSGGRRSLCVQNAFKGIWTLHGAGLVGGIAPAATGDHQGWIKMFMMFKTQLLEKSSPIPPSAGSFPDMSLDSLKVSSCFFWKCLLWMRERAFKRK